MSFKLSKKSIEKLDGVKPELILLVGRAIQLTSVDFGVTQGLRTLEEQKELVASGASKTMKSKHLDGRAVDLVAFLGNRGSWEITLYDDIADAVKQAAKELGIKIRWGAAWHIHDIVAYNGTMQQATNEYIDLRRSEGKRPFIDAPHFELS
jgi:peptidoglycan L-alanyl-D-glutamate endopeptidase CwlK